LAFVPKSNHSYNPNVVESRAINKQKKSCHQFLNFCQNFRQKKINGYFVLYEKHHSHFVLLAYALIFYHYVG
jgi:hypothetical protein